MISQFFVPNDRGNHDQGVMGVGPAAAPSGIKRENGRSTRFTSAEDYARAVSFEDASPAEEQPTHQNAPAAQPAPVYALAA